MSNDERRGPKGLWLVKVAAAGSPLVGAAALVFGVVQAISGELIGYMLVFLSAVMFALGYYFFRILRIARHLPR